MGSITWSQEEAKMDSTYYQLPGFSHPVCGPLLWNPSKLAHRPSSATVSQRKILIYGIWVAGTHKVRLGPRIHSASPSCPHGRSRLTVILVLEGLLRSSFPTSVLAEPRRMGSGDRSQLTALEWAILCSGTSCLFLHL